MGSGTSYKMILKKITQAWAWDTLGPWVAQNPNSRNGASSWHLICSITDFGN